MAVHGNMTIRYMVLYLVAYGSVLLYFHNLMNVEEKGLRHTVDELTSGKVEAKIYSDEVRRHTVDEVKRAKVEAKIYSDEVRVWSTMGYNRVEPCDVKCVYTTSTADVDAYVYELRGRRAPRTTDKVTVYLQLEGAHYYPIDTTGWTVESTYRWQSPILVAYFSFGGYTNFIGKNSPVSFDAIDGVSFLARNCNSKNHRERIITRLIDLGIRVDSMSACLHNAPKPPGNDDKVRIMQHYKFHAAFENGNVDDYVTEKVYLALKAGTIPIYYGASNIDSFVPSGSIIRVDQFESLEELASHLKECMANKSLYDSYHAWRQGELDPQFVKKFNFTHASTECRTCRWIYARRHNYTWRHDIQHFQLK